MYKKLLFVLSLSLIFSLMLVACGTDTSADQGNNADNAPVAGGNDSNGIPTEETDTGDDAPAEGERVQIRWYVGLGVGTNEQERAGQQVVVDAFNASQDRIELVLEIVDVDTAGYDTLNTQIAAGNSPDIVGPVGVAGRDSFTGAWLDMRPLIESTGYDLSDFDPALIDFYNVGGEQLGIPFGIYPSFIYVNLDLFDEAGLPYPPQEYGAPYIDENGVEYEWNFDTLRTLAMKLTVDANGNDATSPDFDADNIVQWGYNEQWTDMRGAGTAFGAGTIIDADNNAQMPDEWRSSLEWLNQGMWEDHFVPTGQHRGSELLNMGFSSGNLAMAHIHLWYAGCCMGEIEFSWDTAAMPSYNGATTAKMHADTFEIMRYTEHPEEAWEVVQYLTGEAAEDLTVVYGVMPARINLQGDFFPIFNEEKFPGQDINWQVVIDSISYADSPAHEIWMPSYEEAKARYDEFYNLMLNNAGLDLDAEITTMLEDLQAIFDAAE